MKNMANSLKADVNRESSSVDVNDVSNLVEDLVAEFDNDLSARTVRMSDEVDNMLSFIETAKADIASMQPATLAKRDLPTAADELDAIVAHTESAASEIMDAADQLSSIAAMCEGEVAAQLQSVTTKIYEASSFQDITGQRITKVVKVIKFIEEKLDGLARTTGDLAARDGIVVTKDANVVDKGDQALLNGPQLDGEGNSQDDIDALLASFD